MIIFRETLGFVLMPSLIYPGTANLKIYSLDKKSFLTIYSYL